MGGSIVLWKALFQAPSKALNAAKSKAKRIAPWHNHGLTPTIKFHGSYDLLDATGENQNQWQGGDKQNGATK